MRAILKAGVLVTAAAALAASWPAAAAKLVFDISMTSQQTCVAFVCSNDAGFVSYSRTLTLDWTATYVEDVIYDYNPPSGELYGRFTDISGPASGSGQADPGLLAFSGLADSQIGYGVGAHQSFGFLPHNESGLQAQVLGSGGQDFSTDNHYADREYYLSLAYSGNAALGPQGSPQTTAQLFQLLGAINQHGGFQVFGFAAINDAYYDPDTNDTLADNSVSLRRWGTATFNPAESAIPEPAAWALLVAGFGLAGGALRRRRTHSSAVAP
ncbi:MAG: sorting protein [Phenylobacterium sp.]|nr:sorting protein [Phenylobacterium sp.]